MCLSAHEAAALGSAGWMVVAHTGSTLQGGMGPGLFQLQRKKTPDYFFFSLILLRSYHAVLQK